MGKTDIVVIPEAPFYCGQCGRFFVKAADNSTRCAVLHPPGSCCHYQQREVPRERWFDQLAKTVAVDFDGVLHPYSEGWIGSTPADESPTKGARTFLAMLVEQGYRVVVFSTRCDHDEGLDGTKAWLEKHGLAEFVDDVTCQKPAAVAYVDDRAVPFKGNWTTVLVGIDDLTNGRAHGAAGS